MTGGVSLMCAGGWQKTPSGTRGLFPAANIKKAPSETRFLFPGDPQSWQIKIQRWQKSAPRMTGRRSHWMERGDDNIFLHLAIVVRLFLLCLRMGLLSWRPLRLVRILYTQVRRSLGEEMTKIEPRNKMLYSPGSHQ